MRTKTKQQCICCNKLHNNGTKKCTTCYAKLRKDKNYYSKHRECLMCGRWIIRFDSVGVKRTLCVSCFKTKYPNSYNKYIKEKNHLHSKIKTKLKQLRQRELTIMRYDELIEYVQSDLEPENRIIIRKT